VNRFRFHVAADVPQWENVIVIPMGNGAVEGEVYFHCARNPAWRGKAGSGRM
jgi:hypothetical protein